MNNTLWRKPSLLIPLDVYYQRTNSHGSFLHARFLALCFSVFPLPPLVRVAVLLLSVLAAVHALRLCSTLPEVLR